MLLDHMADFLMPNPTVSYPPRLWGILIFCTNSTPYVVIVLLLTRDQISLSSPISIAIIVSLNPAFPFLQALIPVTSSTLRAHRPFYKVPPSTFQTNLSRSTALGPAEPLEFNSFLLWEMGFLWASYPLSLPLLTRSWVLFLSNLSSSHKNSPTGGLD